MSKRLRIEEAANVLESIKVGPNNDIIEGLMERKSRRKGSKVCEESTCNKIPKFNSEGAKGARFCSSHRHEGMIDVVNKLCEESG